MTIQELKRFIYSYLSKGDHNIEVEKFGLEIIKTLEVTPSVTAPAVIAKSCGIGVCLECKQSFPKRTGNNIICSRACARKRARARAFKHYYSKKPSTLTPNVTSNPFIGSTPTLAA